MLAIVLANTPRLPDLEDFRRELTRSRDVKIDHARDTMWAFEVDGEPSLVGLVPAPIPWSQLAGPCSTAWWWPEATSVCTGSPAHFIVSTQSADGDLFTANLRLTAIVSALVRAARGAAVYWGAGAVVRSADDFCEQADTATRERLPLSLWLDFRVEQEGTNDPLFATTGMVALGLMEIEAVAPRALAEHVLNRMFNIAHYLCDHGPVLQDGHTLGVTADETIRISHRRSRLERDEKVLFLEFPR